MRIVINDHDIYECREKHPVIITCKDHVTRIVITNGFHSSRVVSCKLKPGYHFYEVGSFLDNIQLLSGLFMTLLFFAIYILSGVRFFMIFANIPVLMLLYILFLKRKSFILIHLLKPHHKIN